MRIQTGIASFALALGSWLAGCSSGESARDLAAEACAGVDLDGKSDQDVEIDPSASEVQRWVDDVSEAADKAAQAAAIDSRYSVLVRALTQVEAETLAAQRMLENFGTNFDSYNSQQYSVAEEWAKSYEAARVEALAECRIIEAG